MTATKMVLRQKKVSCRQKFFDVGVKTVINTS